MSSLGGSSTLADILPELPPLNDTENPPPGFKINPVDVAGYGSSSAAPLPGANLGAQPGSVAGKVNSYVSSVFGFPISQGVAIILGFIFISGGLLLFRPAQQIITKAAKVAAA